MNGAAPARTDSFTHVWRQTLGAFWPLHFAAFAAALFIAGASLPLVDPDLPMHLATGEWIVRHGSVPRVEPFAWTRIGAPYFAYSWASEVAYYEILKIFGPIGLRVLQGLTFVTMGAVIVDLGRVAGWNGWTTLIMAAGNAIVAFGVTPYLRPQELLLIFMPLIWSLTYRALSAERPWASLVGLAIVGACLSNTHLFYPISAASWILLLTRPPSDRRRLWLIPVALIIGWALNPYALHLFDILKLNFAPNPMLGPPSNIGEFMPGFTAALLSGITSLYIAFGLALVPFAVVPRLSPLERVLWGALWVGGLALFGFALRLLSVWWLVTLPLTAMALDGMPVTRERVVLVAQRWMVLALICTFALANIDRLFDPTIREGGITDRELPSLGARPIEPIARWLDCNLRPGARGKLATIFAYGSYIPWRLPYLSASVDGRTIFPDSVATAEAVLTANVRELPLPPWRSADLAIVPVERLLAPVLDTASGWKRVAIANRPDPDGPSQFVGLWVRRGWWSEAGKGELPERTVPLATAPLALRCERAALP